MAYITMRVQESGFTSLSNIFIDDYLPYANASYVTIYIFMYRHCLCGGADFSASDLAGMLHLLESDILNALKYWEQAGLVKLHENTDENLDIEFLPVTPKAKTEVKEKITLQSKAEYTVEEINIYLEKSEEVRNLFAMAQEHLAKLLTFNDMKTIFGLYDWLGLPYEVIDALLGYCAEVNHKGLRYIESVAVDWAENGISSADEAARYLELINGDYRRIMNAFGQTRRSPNKTEIKYMKKWLKEMEMPIELAELACEKTIAQIGQPQFKYADKIISDWHKKGVKTAGDIENIEIERTASAPKKPVTKNKFVNYQQRKWDFDKLKELEYEYIENDLKGN